METIAPSTRMTKPLMTLLGALALLGGLFSVVVLSQGVHDSADMRALSSGLVMFVLGGLGVVYLQLWQRNSRLLVGLDTLGFQDIFGRPHTWSASEVSAVIDATIAYRKSFIQRAVFVLGLDGRRLMALNTLAWDQNSIDRVARAAGKSIDLRSEPVTAVAFRREFPKAMPWLSTNPWAGGLTVIIAVIVGVGIGVVAVLAH